MCEICDAEFVTVDLSCDTCQKEYSFDDAPADSFQTYDGTWFCSVTCGEKAGWQ